MLFLRFTLPLDTGTSSDSRRKGRGRMASELTDRFTLEPLTERWPATLTSGGEGTAAGEKTDNSKN